MPSLEKTKMVNYATLYPNKLGLPYRRTITVQRAPIKRSSVAKGATRMAVNSIEGKSYKGKAKKANKFIARWIGS